MALGSSFANALAVATCLVSVACGNASQGGSPHSNGSGGANGINAFDIVTTEHATEVFGAQAKLDGAEPVVNDVLAGCGYSPLQYPGYGQSLAFTLWRGAAYMGVPSGSEPLAIGDEGYVGTTSIGSSTSIVIVKWLTGEVVAHLEYSTFGEAAPPATDKKQQLIGVAEAVAPKVPNKAP